MKRFLSKLILFICIFTFNAALSFGQTPENFYNKPENINSDPNYTPKFYPPSDRSESKVFYQTKKEELIKDLDPLKTDSAFTLGVGDISFTIKKNETAKVQGYFRNYFGVIKFSEQKIGEIKVIIDVNSLDTAVPGRDNRILDIFFKSIVPDFGIAIIDLLQFSQEGDYLRSSGSIFLNGVSRPISIDFDLKKENNTWVFKSKEAIKILISDFGFESRVYDLMKACNHKSISNTVEVNAELYFR